ncbi:MAG: cytochrome [Phenylobacterium sp.]|nr:cytochrome [Phenylobacterium sp.]
MSYGAETQEASTGVPRHVPPELVHMGLAPGEDTATCPYAQFAAMHEGPRVTFMPPSPMRPQGAWMISRADDVRHVLQQPELFSSHGIAGFSAMVGEAWPLIPLELDPPVHSKYRTILNGIFSPAKIKALEEGVRGRAVALIETVVAKGECEFVEAFARPFPVSIFMQIMGLPDEDFDQLVGWEHDLLHSREIESRLRGAKGFLDYLRGLIAERRANPTDDLASFVVKAEVDGRPLTDDEVMGVYYLLVVAGLDTVAASLGLQFKHLAENPQDQARLRADPSLIPGAVEEFLRRYGIVTTSRFVTEDTEVGGVKMKKGDRLSISTMAPSLDPTEFDNPMQVDIERSPNRHVAFSYGPHRCLGSHLARREIVIAIEEWLTRVPPFHVRGGAAVPVAPGGLLGVNALPLVWT